jgi:hypothetical protein
LGYAAVFATAAAVTLLALIPARHSLKVRDASGT